MKNPMYFIVLSAAGAVLTLLSALPAQAQPPPPPQAQAQGQPPSKGKLIPIAGVDVGWEDMLAGGGLYQKNNHGFMSTLTVGLDVLGGEPLLGMDMAGFHLEQDLGFIDLRTRDDLLPRERRFKGATLAGANGHFLLHESSPVITLSPKLGIGAVYMKAPVASDKSFQSWFAVRPSVSINIMLVCVMIGLEFDYTLGLSAPSVFDDSRATHFISANLKVWI